MHQDSSQLAVNAGVQLRRLCGSVSCRSDSAQKALAEACPLFIVPQSCFSNFQVCRGREYNATSRVRNDRTRTAVRLFGTTKLRPNAVKGFVHRHAGRWIGIVLC